MSKSNCIPRFRDEPFVAELCHLICVMFPRYCTNIAIDDLVIYGMGLKVFENVFDGIDDARYTFSDFIHIINGGGGGGDGDGDGEEDDDYVKMNAIAHNRAKHIASKYVYALRGTIMENWPNTKTYKYCRGLSLVLRRINKHPVKLKCPNLAMLQLQYGEDSQSLPIEFFEGVNKLRVLSLDVPLLPPGLNVLRNLQTLRLKLLKSEDISAIGYVISLKYLSISTVNLTDLPREMGQLSNLRFLDLRKMNIGYISIGVFSRMMKLEELYTPLSFTGWGRKANGQSNDTDIDDEEIIDVSLREIVDGDHEKINASLSEIVSPLLNTLQICVPEASMFPKGSPIFKNVRRFKILIPNTVKYQPFSQGSMNQLQLTGDAFDIKERGSICSLMSRSEYLSLTRMRNLKNVLYQLRVCDFPRLEKMIIVECDDLEYLVDMTEKPIAYSLFWELRILHLSMLFNLKEIWHGRTLYMWFENLRHINIRFCPKLKYVFPMSIASRLRKLQTIEILDCSEMEGIFMKELVDANTFGVYSFEQLHLHLLPKLDGLLVQHEDTIDDTHQSLRMEEVSLNGDEDTRGAFSSESMNNRLENLKKLKLGFCDGIRVIFSFKQNHAAADANSNPVLNSLEELELYSLRNLEHIWFQIPKKSMTFQNLQLLVLYECHNSYVFVPRVAKLLVRLQKIHISRCEKMKEIIAKDDEEEEVEAIVFPQLKVLELQQMPILEIFYGGDAAIEFSLLESLKINHCNKMESFSYGSLTTPMLETIQINESSCSLMEDLNATIKRGRD
ncbi:disease resistance protein RPS2-like isoform X2 [Euphorbia lathyris]|uniref:disease resistance protein RPS2-like isoform X2 n=1 Tax=Euphorbia lathyris TaxID=212925 RepID=UPI003313C7D6